QRPEVERVAGDPRGEPDRLVDRQSRHRTGQFAGAIGPDQAFLVLQPEHPRELSGRDQLGDPEADREPAERARQPVRPGERARPLFLDDRIALRSGDLGGIGEWHDVYLFEAKGVQGWSMTLMQLSALSRNVRYISGPLDRSTLWVMTKEGSIWPSSIRRSRSPVQRGTCACAIRKVRPLFIAWPIGI